MPAGRSLSKKGFVLFRKHVDDISPLSKVNGYIGVTDGGVISTFHGRPGSLAEPIQSFFQIDLERLESRLQKALGTRYTVQDKSGV